MIQNKIYYTSVMIWLSLLLMFALATAIAGTPAADVYIARAALINAAGAILFLAIYETLYLFDLDPRNENNLTRKDLTFLLLLVFGPFGLIPVLFISIACFDKPAKKFDRLVRENPGNIAEDAIFNYIDAAGEYQRQMFKEAVIDSAMSESISKKRNAIEILSKIRTRQAVAVLKLMARDKEYEVRFMAINKLNAIEDEYVREFDRCKSAVRVCGAIPELIFQYAVLMMKFCRFEVLYEELTRLYYRKAAALFRALIDADRYRSESLFGYSVCLRNSGDAAGAAEMLEKNLGSLGGDAVDELAACYFDLKRNVRLAELIGRVKNGELPHGKMLEKIIAGRVEHDLDDNTDENEGESELYAIRKSADFVKLLAECENASFDEYYARLKTATNPSIYPAAFNDVCGFSKFCRIVYLKLLKGQIESDNARNLRYFLYDTDAVMVFFALDVLSSTELPLRNELFMDLLLHPMEEVRIVAAVFAGMKKMRRAAHSLIKTLKSPKSSETLKKEIITALIKIGDSAAASGISYSLSRGGIELCIHALGEIKKYRLRGFFDQMIALADSGPDPVKAAAISATASFGDDKAFQKLEKYLAGSAGEAARETAAAEFCRALRPEVIEHAAFYYSKKGDARPEDFMYYFSYLGKKHIEKHIDDLISSGRYVDNQSIKIIIKHRGGLASEIIEKKRETAPEFYALYGACVKGGEK